MYGGIGELARSRLQLSPYFALRGIGCDYQDGVLTLWGFLPSHYLKQVAQATVSGVAGVTTVVNAIQVLPPPWREAAGRVGELR